MFCSCPSSRLGDDGYFPGEVGFVRVVTCRPGLHCGRNITAEDVKGD